MEIKLNEIERKQILEWIKMDLYSVTLNQKLSFHSKLSRKWFNLEYYQSKDHNLVILCYELWKKKV